MTTEGARDLVNGTRRLVYQMTDLEAVQDESIGDQSSVAPPPADLGAHERDGLAGLRAHLESGQRGPEGVREHIRGVGGEAMRPPWALYRGRRGQRPPTT